MIQIDNALSGESVVREMTTQEQEQLEAEVAANEQQKEIKEQQKAEAAAKKAAAEAKLEALGLTAEDLKALGL